MRRRSRGTLALASVALLAGAFGCSEPREPVRPSFVFIISDDQGWRDYGFMGSTIAETPNIDRLADEGTTFDLAYTTSSTCKASLRSILTGLYPHQLSMRLLRMRRAGRKPYDGGEIQDFATIPRLLSEHGYTTFQAGKRWERTPAVAGFDEGTGEADQVARVYGDLTVGRQTLQPVFDFLDRHGSEPFLLWYAPMLPHTPFNAPARFTSAFEGRDLPEAAAAYYANVAWFDETVGRLLDRLEEMGLGDDTVIVFLADNGFDALDGLPRAEAPEIHPLLAVRGKGTVYELGFRTPLIFRWPGRIAAGVREDGPVSTVDLLPTVLAWAGVAPPPGVPGKSLRPLLEGTGEHPRSSIMGQLRARQGLIRRPTNFLRNAKHHFIEFGDGTKSELYEPATDPEERRNLAEDAPALVRQYSEEIATWLRETARPPPKPKPEPEPTTGEGGTEHGPAAREPARPELPGAAPAQ